MTDPKTPKSAKASDKGSGKAPANEDLRDEFLRELESIEFGADGLEGLVARLPTTQSDDGLRARLLLSSQHTHRFEELVATFASDADISEEQANILLLAIDDPTRWEPAPLPNVTLLHFDGGPRTARAITGFVRIDPGARFPEHDHLGEEVVVVLQGECRDTSNGKTYSRGDRVVTHPGTEHAIEVSSDIPFIYIAIAQEGLTIGDREFLYDDPDT